MKVCKIDKKTGFVETIDTVGSYKPQGWYVCVASGRGPINGGKCAHTISEAKKAKKAEYKYYRD